MSDELSKKKRKKNVVIENARRRKKVLSVAVTGVTPWQPLG
jgi:hypothetical protein